MANNSLMIPVEFVKNSWRLRRAKVRANNFRGRKSNLFIHASNVMGLGASQVVGSLIEAIIRQYEENKLKIHVALPGHGKLTSLSVDGCSCVNVKRILPNAVSRVLECLFPRIYHDPADNTLVLGDIPLMGYTNQVILVHQSHLIKPHIHANSSSAINFKLMRLLFACNLKYVSTVIVQSDVMKEHMLASYPILKGRVKVIPQPAPNWFCNFLPHGKINHQGLRLFYPAAGYPHKNHVLIERLAPCVNHEKLDVLFLLTLQHDEISQYKFDMEYVKNLGRVSPLKCMQTYAQVDALFFPSLAESYGLPLVEAMLIGLPIVCADLPYARWMCGGDAIYFNAEDETSACKAIIELEKRLKYQWKPDWSDALQKLPKDWDDVAQKYMALCVS